MYARKEPTTDSDTLKTLKAHGWEREVRRLKDVVVYRDRACTKPVARFTWCMSSKPKFGSKGTMLNCYWTPLTWLAPLT